MIVGRTEAGGDSIEASLEASHMAPRYAVPSIGDGSFAAAMADVDVKRALPAVAVRVKGYSMPALIRVTMSARRRVRAGGE